MGMTINHLNNFKNSFDGYEKSKSLTSKTRPLSPKLHNTYPSLDPDCLTSLISVDSVRLKNDQFEPYKIKIISLKKGNVFPCYVYSLVGLPSSAHYRTQYRQSL